jgi:Protein of unknown function (DUF998)
VTSGRSTPTLRRPDARITAGLVLLFWVGTLVGGALAPGYDLTQDYVSSLAGRGSAVAPIGIAAIALLGLAHLAAARGRLAVPLGLAGVAGLTIAAFRTACPYGAAGCGTAPNTAADLPGTVHGLAVVGYEVAVVAAMVVVAVSRPRDEKVFAVLAAVLSVVLLLNTGGAFNGLWQRGWLLVNTGWLVATVSRGTARPRPAPGPPAAIPGS